MFSGFILRVHLLQKNVNLFLSLAYVQFLKAQLFLGTVVLLHILFFYTKQLIQNTYSKYFTYHYLKVYLFCTLHFAPRVHKSLCLGVLALLTALFGSQHLLRLCLVYNALSSSCPISFLYAKRFQACQKHGPVQHLLASELQKIWQLRIFGRERDTIDHSLVHFTLAGGVRCLQVLRARYESKGLFFRMVPYVKIKSCHRLGGNSHLMDFLVKQAI